MYSLLSVALLDNPYFIIAAIAAIISIGLLLVAMLSIARRDRALELSETRYRSLYSSMSEGVSLHKFIYDETGKVTDYQILDINPAFETLTNTTRERAIGNMASEFFQTTPPPFLDEFLDVFESGEPTTFEAYVDVLEKHFHISVFLPEEQTFALALQDITEQKHAQQKLDKALQQSIAYGRDLARVYSDEKRRREELESAHHLLDAVFTSTPDALVVLDDDLMIQQANPAFRDLIELTQSDVVGTSIRELFLGKQLVDLLTEGPTEAALSDTEINFTLNHDVSLSLIVKVARLQSSVQQGWVIVLHDRTQRKQTEEALWESQHRYQALFEGANDAIFVLSLAGVHITVNQRAASMLGYEIDELIGMSYRDIVNASEYSGSEQSLAALLAGETLPIYERTFIRKSGEKFPVEINVVLVRDRDGNPLHIQSVVRDITDRKEAERAEREQRALAEALRDTASILSSTLDLDAVLERILSNVGRVVPHDASNIMLMKDNQVSDLTIRGQDGKEISPAESFYNLDNIHILEQMVALGEPAIIADLGMYDYPTTLSPEWARSFVGSPIQVEGNVIGFLCLGSRRPCFFSDDHASKLKIFANQAALAIQNAQLYQELEAFSEHLVEAVEERTAELRNSKERVEVILNNSPDAILLLDANSAIKTGNAAFIDLFGYHIDELYEQPPSVFVAEEAHETLQRAIKAAIEERQPQHREIVIQAKDGTPIDVSAALSPIRGETQDVIEGIVCSLRDISALKQVERMKDAFVSNVSHELRTPITSFKLFLSLLRTAQADERDEMLDILQRETNRLHHIIEDVLRLSRLDQGRAQLQFDQVDLHELVSRLVEDRVPLAAERNIDLSVALHKDDLQIWADEGLISQTFTVLLTNAMNYTLPGGSIIVSTSVEEAAEGEWACFSVQDTGPGIPSEEQEHMFDRFFRGQVGRESTIPGTGLGLAIAKEIVDRHHGRIVYTGIENEGSHFRVILPMGVNALLQD